MEMILLGIDTDQRCTMFVQKKGGGKKMDGIEENAAMTHFPPLELTGSKRIEQYQIQRF